MATFYAHIATISSNLGSTYFRIPVDCTLTKATLFLSNHKFRGWNSTNTCSIFSQTSASFDDTGEQVSPCYTFDGIGSLTVIDVTNFSDWSNLGSFKANDIIWIGWCENSACCGAAVQCTLDFLVS
jgi:hypothetical protein